MKWEPIGDGLFGKVGMDGCFSFLIYPGKVHDSRWMWRWQIKGSAVHVTSALFYNEPGPCEKACVGFFEKHVGLLRDLEDGDGDGEETRVPDVSEEVGERKGGTD